MSRRGLVYVNAYSVGRCYGGPEEGGWWFDAGTPLASVPVNAGDERAIERARRRLRSQLGWAPETSQGRYSVIGGDDFEVWVEDEVAAPFPARRPHYE